MDPLTALMQPVQHAEAPLDAWLLLSIFGAAVVAAGASILAARVLRSLRNPSASALAAHQGTVRPLARFARTEGVARRAA